MHIALAFLNVVSFVVICDAVLSWIQGPDDMPRSLTSSFTAPLYAPIHAVLKPEQTGNIDFSPLIVLIAIQMLGNFIAGAW